MKPAFENHAFFLAILAALPGCAAAFTLLVYSELNPHLKWSIAVGITALSFSTAWYFRQRLQYRLRTVSNLLAGLREGDYSTKGRDARQGDVVGEILLEVNALALSRQIAESHGGTLTLKDGPDGGCVALIEIPTLESGSR